MNTNREELAVIPDVSGLPYGERAKVVSLAQQALESAGVVIDIYDDRGPLEVLYEPYLNDSPRIVARRLGIEAIIADQRTN